MKYCKQCGRPIPDLENGNRMYCTNMCYEAAKRIRQNAKYADLKSRQAYLRQSERLLEILFDQYGPQQYLSAAWLEDRQFDFNLSQGIMTIEGNRANIVGKYAYVIFTNQTVRIWKI